MCPPYFAPGGRGMYTVRNTVEIKNKYLQDLPNNEDDNQVVK